MRRRRSGCWTALVGTLIAAMFGVGTTVLWWKWALQPVGGEEHRTIRIEVARGEADRLVGAEMERRGLIRSAFVFDWAAHQRRFKPGIYDFSTIEGPHDILGRLVHGDIATAKVTFPEGFTLKQIAQRLAERGVITDAGSFLTLVSTQGDTLMAGGRFAAPANLEGYLFPSTYRFPVGATDRKVAAQMLSEFDRVVVVAHGDEIKASGRTLNDIITIASLVEGEAEIDADRPRIAGVIYNRLGRQMHLEIDASVQYAQGFHKTRLLYRDLAIDSPYNTYRIYGLPPSPICCPGIPSILAALHPTVSDYLYYVAGPDGHAHVFARTLAEHQANVARMRRLRGAL